jgi:hypothetical protein
MNYLIGNLYSRKANEHAQMHVFLFGIEDGQVDSPKQWAESELEQMMYARKNLQEFTGNNDVNWSYGNADFTDLENVMQWKFLTDDGYTFFMAADGQIVDNLDPDQVDLSYASLDDFMEWNEHVEIQDR